MADANAKPQWAPKKADECAKYNYLRIHLDRMDNCLSGTNSTRLNHEVWETEEDSYCLVVRRLSHPQWHVRATHPTHNKRDGKDWKIEVYHEAFEQPFVFHHFAHLSSELIAGVVGQSLLMMDYLDLDHLKEKLF